MYIYLEFLPFLLHLFIGKSTVPDLHVCIIEWVVCGICDMVDTVSVSLDDSLGRDHAAPTKIPKKIQPIVYMIVNACHGFLFGTLYAPAQAILLD